RVIVDAISRVENRVTLINSQKDMQGATGDAVKALFGGPALAALDEQKLLMGPVTYADSRQGSSFGLQLQQVIRQNLTKIEGLIVVEPIKRNTAVVEQAIKTRGIGMNEKTPALGTPAMQAMIDGAQVALEVTYTVQGMEVWVEMFLKEAGTDILKGASSAIIDRNTIPVTLELIPDLADTLPPSVDSASAVKLVVTSHLGDGQTYQEGDTISYFVSSNRDAFVLLIYEDAEHNLIQILPNKYSGNGFFKAGNYMEVPAASDPFEFLIQGPFGIEKLWAFALTKPLPKLSGMELENGLTLLSDKMDVILGLLRAYGNQSGVSYGEAKTIVTTVPRR
ncbi:MAG: DUF4384 domain-containing protein, partial [Proteobacteria bacterium]|nr:DUF4384 domain-containing protein [Pseudomonadota bacterium]MBU1709202.1 DUF4384 domain-containing protein [Pseudomonadota bacterium]